jgi:putative transposase
MAERNQLAGTAAGVSAPAKAVLGRHFWARGYLAVSSGAITDEMTREYIDEQEGEQIADDSRFPIDNT